MQVWQFIMDREVEAPERFRAIQTYRATMAVLKQQAAFIKSMYNSGLVDDMEHDELQRSLFLKFASLLGGNVLFSACQAYSPTLSLLCSLPSKICSQALPQ